MIRGFQTSKLGMSVEQSRMDVLANNLANVNTNGFKRSVLLSSEFERMLLQRLDDTADGQAPSIGTLGNGATVDQVTQILRQGDIVETGRDLDFAIQGDGQFTVQGPGGVTYTRNGAFDLTSDGTLVTSEGNAVLVQTAGGDLAPLTNLKAMPTVAADGMVTVAGQTLGRLALQGSTPESRIRSRALEASNVELAKEMTDMIIALRSFQVNQRALQMQDQTLSRATTEIGKL